MGWPVTFGTAVSPEALSNLDLMFNQAAAQISIPCSAVGVNAIALTPLTNCPALLSYNDLGGYRFIAAGNSTAAVTLQYNGLGFLPVYHADGLTQANIGDLIGGEQYIATFHQALNGGGGGFYLESPSVPNAASTWFTPGGRLTFQSSQPIMFSNQLGQQIIYYAPYVHPFVPIFNGANVQMYQFTSSLGDTVGLQLNMAGSASWPANSLFDLFVTLNGGIPTLGTIAWTNPTTRATTLSIEGGFLTNSGAATLRIGAASTIALASNQGTFLGTFSTAAAGTTQWQFGSSASGGIQATWFLDNYYNKVLFTTSVIDNGANYTYTSSTVRQARASTQNQVQIASASSERAIIAVNNVETSCIAVNANTNTGIGINSTIGYQSQAQQATTASSLILRWPSILSFTITGFVTISRNESGDGTNANVFDFSTNDTLQVSAWL